MVSTLISFEINEFIEFERFLTNKFIGVELLRNFRALNSVDAQLSLKLREILTIAHAQMYTIRIKR